MKRKGCSVVACADREGPMLAKYRILIHTHDPDSLLWLYLCLLIIVHSLICLLNSSYSVFPAIYLNFLSHPMNCNVMRCYSAPSISWWLNHSKRYHISLRAPCCLPTCHMMSFHCLPFITDIFTVLCWVTDSLLELKSVLWRASAHFSTNIATFSSNIALFLHNSTSLVM